VNLLDAQRKNGIDDLRRQNGSEVARGNRFGLVVWLGDGEFAECRDAGDQDEPIRRMRNYRLEPVLDCRILFEGGVLHCRFEGLLTDESIALRLTRGEPHLDSLAWGLS
jgi:hypothetical protein